MAGAGELQHDFRTACSRYAVSRERVEHAGGFGVAKIVGRKAGARHALSHAARMGNISPLSRSMGELLDIHYRMAIRAVRLSSAAVFAADGLPTTVERRLYAASAY